MRIRLAISLAFVLAFIFALTSHPLMSAPPLQDEELAPCEDLWTLARVQEAGLVPILSLTGTDYALITVVFDLTNEQRRTDFLEAGDLHLVGNLSDESMRYEAIGVETSSQMEAAGFAAWSTPLRGGRSVRAVALFLVDPEASQWTLELTISDDSTECTSTLLLDPSDEPVVDSAEAEPEAVDPEGVTGIVSRSANLRSGPGTDYPIAGQASQGDQVTLLEQNADGTWYKVCCSNDNEVWIAGFLLDIDGDAAGLPKAEGIAPPPTPTVSNPPAAVPTVSPPVSAPVSAPAATSTLSKDRGVGSSAQQVGTWSLKLYDVKKAKAVYWFGDGDFANGVWLVPLVEFVNNASGTRSPIEDLDFYLQDASGRQYNISYVNDGSLGAAWQFQAGRLYDDIDPGILLGIAIPHDVSPDMGDTWLRVRQNASVYFYLGNISQLPQEN